MSAEPTRSKRTGLWVSTTYFAEGLPYMIVRWMSGVYFTDIGAKESVLGYLNWLGIPWNFKFLWASLVDMFGTRRRWLIGVELLLSVLMLLLAWLTSLGPTGQGSASQPVTTLSWPELQAAIDPSTGLTHATVVTLIVGLFVLMAFVAATNDIATDAFYMEGIPDRDEQAAYSGLRVFAYRIAVVFARTALIGFSAWYQGFACAGLIMFALFVWHFFVAPRFASDGAKPLGERPAYLLQFGRAFGSYLQQERIAVILLFVITYKFGDEIMFSMNTAFLMRELQVTRGQMQWLGGGVGMVSTAFGAVLGGVLIKRFGFKRAVWPLTLTMNLSVWVYVLLAQAKPNGSELSGIALISVAHGFEYFAAGLGNAVITVFLLYTCKLEFKAAHYAIGTALMSVPGNFLGGFAGQFVETYGYVALYLVAFASSLPSMFLLLRLPLDSMLAKKS